MGLAEASIIAVELGAVVALGCNRYRGWRIGPRSFDNVEKGMNILE